MQLVTHDLKFQDSRIPLHAGYIAKFISKSFQEQFLQNRQLKCHDASDPEIVIESQRKYYSGKNFGLEDLIFSTVNRERLRDYKNINIKKNNDQDSESTGNSNEEEEAQKKNEKNKIEFYTMKQIVDEWPEYKYGPQSSTEKNVFSSN